MRGPRIALQSTCAPLMIMCLGTFGAFTVGVSQVPDLLILPIQANLACKRVFALLILSIASVIVCQNNLVGFVATQYTAIFSSSFDLPWTTSFCTESAYDDVVQNGSTVWVIHMKCIDHRIYLLLGEILWPVTFPRKY